MKPILFLFLTTSILLSCQDTPQEKQPDNNMETTDGETGTLTQAELQQKIFPLLKEKGTVYRKHKKIFARSAKEGERIGTRTSDGLETTNTAKEGDFVVKNQTEAGEEYIIGAEKFAQRYRFLSEAEGEYSEYESIGKVVALEMTEEEMVQLNFPPEFHFIAPWEEKMVCKKDDFLVSPLDFSQVYRIARKEFFETYRLEE